MGEPFSEKLRRAIRDSELSRYAISARTGIDQGTLSRFMKGERGLSLSAIDKLMDVLGLDIRPRRKRKDD
ncbi:MAG: helix-turn-helix transcriptional regulator [Patescibacteria group bacterium]|nr:helix-turn-helix transcriptional regulator [Patescibacteria group bacterium]